MTNDIPPTLAELVTARPAAARVLDRHGLDYCCHGDRTLAEACASAGVDAATVEEELDRLRDGEDRDWTGLELVELLDRIEETHHAYLHTELPELEVLAAKVRDVHGERHPELERVAALVTAVRADLEPHLEKEERILFPAIRALAAGMSDRRGRISDPIRVMRAEHDRAGELLAELRSATGGYTVPADGCASYRSLYERLEVLELDTHLHVLRENHRVFPEAIALAGRKVTLDPGGSRMVRSA